MRMRTPVVLVAAVVLAGVVGSVATSPASATTTTSTWSVRTVPLPHRATTTANSVARVACASDQLCALIVSAARVDGAQQNVAAILRNGTFTAPTVLPSAVARPFLPRIGGVSCPSNQLCFAAGSDGDARGLFDTFDGESWTASQAPGQPYPGEVGFTDASCGATTCLATGFYVEFDGRVFPLAVQRDNATGALQHYQVSFSGPAAKDRNRYQQLKPLYGPACPTTGRCSALAYGGYYAYPRSADYQAVRLPVPDGISQADLQMGGGMSCASATDCAALGTVIDATGTHQYLVAEMLAGGVLSVRNVGLPDDIGTLHDPLQARAISCPTVVRCVGVVGFRRSTARHGAWLVRRTGSTWHASRAPLPADAIGPDAGDLTGVSCMSASACVAVGTYRTAAGLRPLVETIAGATVTPTSPAAPPGDVTLQDVSCAQSTCLASGFRRAGGTVRPVVAIARPDGSG